LKGVVALIAQSSTNLVRAVADDEDGSVVGERPASVNGVLNHRSPAQVMQNFGP